MKLVFQVEGKLKSKVAEMRMSDITNWESPGVLKEDEATKDELGEKH